MKVLFLLTYYHPHWTGLTQYAKRVAEGLRERNFEVRVLTTKHDPKLSDSERIGGVMVMRKPVWGRISRSMISPGLWLEMAKAIYKADRVIIFLPMVEAVWAVELAKLMGKQVILVHNGDLVLPPGRINRILEKIYYWTGLLAIKRSGVIVIHTEDYAKNSKLLSEYPEKWRVILPPIAKMQPKKELVDRLKKKIGGNGVVVGFAGRWVEEKGFDVLLRAMPVVKRAFGKVKFAYAGDIHVSYENFFMKNKHLVEGAGRDLVEMGLLSLDDMASFYKLCDVFVVSSRTDCFPVTQIEAMLCGTPVVVTNIPGARWVVGKTGMGMVVAGQNPEALAEGIIKVVKDKERYKKFRSRAEKLFDYQKSITDYERLLREEKN